MYFVDVMMALFLMIQSDLDLLSEVNIESMVYGENPLLPFSSTSPLVDSDSEPGSVAICPFNQVQILISHLEELISQYTYCTPIFILIKVTNAYI